MFALRLPAGPRQVFGEALGSLAEVLHDGVNLAVWQRRLPVHLEDFCGLLAASDETLADSRVIDCAGTWQPGLADLANRFAGLDGHAAFVADVTWLVELYTELLEARRIGLRLRLLDKAMCPRFHVDPVPLRLVCSYAGPGSQWLAEGAMDRRRLGDALAEPTAAEAIHSLRSGEVALLKGERWKGNEGAGLIHRSPTLAAGQRRLLLTLDWLA